MNRLVVGAVSALMLLTSHAKGADDATTVDVEIVLAVDVSSSVSVEELAIQRAGYIQALRHPALLQAVAGGSQSQIALSYVEWSGRVFDDSVVPWRIIRDNGDIAHFAASIASLPLRSSHGTSISRALDFSNALIESNGIQGARNVIDISGDGPNTLGPPVTEARDRAISNGITVNGLPILINPSNLVDELDSYFNDCVVGGRSAFLLDVHSPVELSTTIRRKLIQEISGTMPPPKFTVVADRQSTDCLVGEKIREQYVDPHFPGLYE